MMPSEVLRNLFFTHVDIAFHIAAYTPFESGRYVAMDLLKTLERCLSDAYTLFQSVKWARGQGQQEQHGEVMTQVFLVGAKLVQMRAV